MKNLEDFKEFMSVPRRGIIVTHIKPDADALGSSLGLYHYLIGKGHQITLVTPSDYPDFIKWMPGQENVWVFDETRMEEFKQLLANSEVVFCLDFSNLSRINPLGDLIRTSNVTKVLIDHHLEPEDFARFVLWDTTAASTAELVARLILALGDRALITPDIASCLYAGVMTDTGGFRHSNTTHKVFETASMLVALGADPSKISKLIYDNNTLERLRLMGYVLSEKLVVLPEYRTAYIVLSVNDLKRFQSQTGDTEGLVNYGLSIKGIKLSVMISDRKDSIKLSFRSLGEFSVNDLARKYFDGGGHRNAAGGQTNTTLEETVDRFLRVLPEYKHELLKD